MGADDRLLECGRHTPGHLVWSSRSLQKPRRLSLTIPPDPFVHPLSTASQTVRNPTDRPLLPPPAYALLAFLNQRRTFFDSYGAPPNGLEIVLSVLPVSANCQRCLVRRLSTMCCHVTVRLKAQYALCNPNMIMSGLAKVEMSASLIDYPSSQGGWDGRRGQSTHE
jgi:hypothetical protein